MIQLPTLNGDIDRDFFTRLLDAVQELQNCAIVRLDGPMDFFGGCLSVNIPRARRVMVRNTTEADVAQYGILGIDTTIDNDPGDNLPIFKAMDPCFHGVTPAVPDHVGKFVVVLQDIPAGGWGEAVAMGVVQCQVDIVTEGDRWADVTDADSTALTSRANGTAEILWPVSGTGLQWTIVRFGVMRSDGFPVLVTSDGGADGDQTNPATWTYTVKDPDGNTLKKNTAGDPATTMPLTRPRPNGVCVAGASWGWAFRVQGTLYLWDAGEVYGTATDCPPPS